MIFNIQPRTMTATQMKVELIPPYTSDLFNTYWEIITSNGKVIDRGNMAVPLQYMPIFINVIQSINQNGDVIGDTIRAELNAILNSPNIDLSIADLPTQSSDSGTQSNDSGTQSSDSGTQSSDSGTQSSDSGTQSSDSGTQSSDSGTQSNG